MKTLKDMLVNDRFAAEAGVELLEVREGYARARMQVTERHLNAGGVCQGGALFTLADLAFAAVANSRNQLTLSLNAHITFFRSVSSGYVYAEAVETYTHAKIPYVEVRLADEAGNPIAQFCSSGYRKQFSLDLEGLM